MPATTTATSVGAPSPGATTARQQAITQPRTQRRAAPLSSC